MSGWVSKSDDPDIPMSGVDTGFNIIQATSSTSNEPSTATIQNSAADASDETPHRQSLPAINQTVPDNATGGASAARVSSSSHGQATNSVHLHDLLPEKGVTCGRITFDGGY